MKKTFRISKSNMINFEIRKGLSKCQSITNPEIEEYQSNIFALSIYKSPQPPFKEGTLVRFDFLFFSFSFAHINIDKMQQRIHEETLLSKEDFIKHTMNRDGYKCVFCNSPAFVAHHIMDKRLFTDGGYYLGNSASVCGKCHSLCERMVYSVEDIRDKAKIYCPVIPEGFDKNKRYDKWGNEVVGAGILLKGPLFHDETAQETFKQENMLWRFAD